MRQNCAENCDVLTSTTTASALSVSRFSVSSELYGCTTTSDESAWFGKTEYVWISFFGKWSFSRSSRNEPIPEPVPPAIEWQTRKPSSDSEVQSKVVSPSSCSS